MADMTVLEATKLKGEMEQKIADAIADFVNATGLRLLDIRLDVDAARDMNQQFVAIVTARVTI